MAQIPQDYSVEEALCATVARCRNDSALEEALSFRSWDGELLQARRATNRPDPTCSCHLFHTEASRGAKCQVPVSGTA